jgi:hypothetical protein
MRKGIGQIAFGWVWNCLNQEVQEYAKGINCLLQVYKIAYEANF